jgi:hypothetical protein
MAEHGTVIRQYVGGDLSEAQILPLGEKLSLQLDEGEPKPTREIRVLRRTPDGPTAVLTANMAYIIPRRRWALIECEDTDCSIFIDT